MTIIDSTYAYVPSNEVELRTKLLIEYLTGNKGYVQIAGKKFIFADWVPYYAPLQRSKDDYIVLKDSAELWSEMMRNNPELESYEAPDYQAVNKKSDPAMFEMILYLLNTYTGNHGHEIGIPKFDIIKKSDQVFSGVTYYTINYAGPHNAQKRYTLICMKDNNYYCLSDFFTELAQAILPYNTDKDYHWLYESDEFKFVNTRCGVAKDNLNQLLHVQASIIYADKPLIVRNREYTVRLKNDKSMICTRANLNIRVTLYEPRNDFEARFHAAILSDVKDASFSATQDSVDVNDLYTKCITLLRFYGKSVNAFEKVYEHFDSTLTLRLYKIKCISVKYESIGTGVTWSCILSPCYDLCNVKITNFLASQIDLYYDIYSKTEPNAIKEKQTRPVITLLAISSLDSRQLTGNINGKDYMQEGLTTYNAYKGDAPSWSLLTGEACVKLGYSFIDTNAKTDEYFVIVDGNTLNSMDIKRLCNKAQKVIIITNNKEHAAVYVKETNLHVIVHAELDLGVVFEKLYSEYSCKEITITADNQLTTALMSKDFIDVVDIMLAPVLLGSTDVLNFANEDSQINIAELAQLGELKPRHINKFDNSFVLLNYAVVR